MKERIKYLLGKFEEGTLSAEETELLLELTGMEEEAVAEGISAMMQEEREPSPEITGDLIWSGMLTKIVAIDKPQPIQKKPILVRFRWLAAAVVLLTLSAGLYFYQQLVPELTKVFPEQFTADIAPGGNKAILTLSDGSEISLTDAENGALTKQSGIKIIKTADGQLVYDASAAKSSSEASNTITTPRGGQYQVNLPDGTKVWLNAASSLKFPLTFTDQKNRIVELSGEAYFEVAKNKNQPFKVITEVRPDQEGRAQIIEVLGTHFNVNAYPDEESIRTTLLEGSVRLNNKVILKPGQQSIFAYDHFHLVPADTEEAVAWKNGYFMFANEDLRSIMRKISRWYDLEIVYQGKTTDNTFIGTVSRFKEVSEVLNILELTRTVHFKIEGRRITVMP